MNLNVILQLLNEKSNVNVLSEPRVFTSDNQEAEFFDGQDIPFVTDSQVTDTGNQINSFDYRAVGIRLAARPRITATGNIDLRVNVELSSIRSGETLFGAFIVDRRETTTQVIVQNGQTIVISGIRRSQIVDVVRKVPILGDIPLLNLLFKSRDKQNEQIELLVFITPIVVDNSNAADDVNQPYRDRLEQKREEMGVEDDFGATGDAGRGE
jgi:type II secretory pathway component GspD/PulD (secretin)